MSTDHGHDRDRYAGGDQYDVGFGRVANPSSTYCRHGEVIVLPTDPDPYFLQTCEHPGAGRVPRPETDAPVALCAWHLARYRDAFPDVWADLQADYGLNELVPDEAVTTLDDAPMDLPHSGRDWRRFALDQQGHVHYASRHPHDDPQADLPPAILEVDGSFEQVTVTEVDPNADAAYMDDVRGEVGWAEIEAYVKGPKRSGAGGDA